MSINSFLGPIILAAAIDGSKYTDLIEAVTSTGGIADLAKEHKKPEDDGLFRITTKYYETSAQFHPLNRPTLSIESIVERIEAVILHLDHPLDSLEKELADWEPVVLRANAEVNILASKHSIPEDQKEAVLAWCIKNGCELIELERDGNATADSDSDLCEKFGVERLVEALQTHYWPIFDRRSLSRKGRSHKCTFGHNERVSPFDVPTNTPNDTPPEYATDNCCSYEDNLDDLFQTFKTMKSELPKLDRLERIDRAEQAMKMAFASFGFGRDVDDSDSDSESAKRLSTDVQTGNTFSSFTDDELAKYLIEISDPMMYS